MATLPPPDADALRHSEALQTLIRERLSGGCMSFAEYMQLALYAPGGGYYMSGARQFGTAGDFITAPETSGLFGRALARQCREILTQTGGGVLELGAGSGRLAVDLVSALCDVADFHYTILEPSAALVERQAARLKTALGERLALVRWLDRLPDAFRGVIVANEVADALPVERFVAGESVEQTVVCDDRGRLVERQRVAPPALADAVRGIETRHGALPRGYRSELCLLLEPWIGTLIEMLEQGVLLLIDYGYPEREYYLPERACGTLACFYRHRVHHDPCWLPGLCDISAHVDFSRAARGGLDRGAALLGYTNQANFLLSLGVLDDVGHALALADDQREAARITRDVKTLTLPGEMGERFQVMALAKGYHRPLSGFALRDLGHRL